MGALIGGGPIGENQEKKVQDVDELRRMMEGEAFGDAGFTAGMLGGLGDQKASLRNFTDDL